MVRPRLQLERLNGELSREHYYLHSKSVVSKKVNEMSTLTGTDVLFLAFSPVGVPTLHLGQHSDFLNMVMRFSRIPFNDREKRRLDNLQTLRANYQKEGYNIDVHALFHAWKVKRLQDMQEKLATLKEELSNLNEIKSCWENPQSVDNIETINAMEATLQESLEDVRKRKNQLIGQQMMINPAPVAAGPSLEPFEDYLPEMLSGNDELLAYANNLLMDGNPPDNSENKSQ